MVLPRFRCSGAAAVFVRGSISSRTAPCTNSLTKASSSTVDTEDADPRCQRRPCRPSLGHSHHDLVRPWFDALLAGDEDFGVPSFVWASHLRLATNRRVFEVSSPRPDVFAFIDAVVAQPRYLAVSSGPRHLSILRRLCDEGDATGDLIPDAVLGAIAVEHGATIATLDRDFARFASVRHVRPG